MIAKTHEEIASMIESIGIPFAYYQFPEGTAEPTPFICFYYAGEEGVFADNQNYVELVNLTIELYTDAKDFSLEKKIRDLLNDNELPFRSYESYIDTEQMLLNTYETEVYINGN